MKTLGLLLAVLLTSHAAAEVVPPPTLEETLADKATRLARGNYAHEREPLSHLVSDLANSITQAGPHDQLFALALAQLAIAEAGTGEVDDAIWHWQIAQNIDRSISTLDLSPYGRAGDVLRANVLPPAPAKCTRPANAPAPRVAKRSEPNYPRAAREVPVTGLVIVELHVDQEGRPLQPQVLKSPLSVLTYSTLVTLRNWRFEPSREDGDAPFCRLFSFGNH